MTHTRPIHRLPRFELTLALLVSPALAHAQSSPAPAANESNATPHGPSSSAFPSHHFQLAPHSPERAQLGVNFGLLQLALHGVNVAAELRYKRLWLEYSHGEALTLNHLSASLTSSEREQNLHVYVPYTTGFGVGFTLVDELWLGLEFKAHRYEVSNTTGLAAKYNTYSVGPVLGYKLFIWRGLYTDLYARYWPNVATTLSHGRLDYTSEGRSLTHEAHDWGLFANASIGWAFDL